MVDRPPPSPDFDEMVLPHRDAAYNLALCIMTSTADAEDVTQEAMVRAWRALAQLRSGSARTWLLRIVRNTAYTHLDRRKRTMNIVPLDQATRRRDQKGRGLEFADDTPNAETELIRADEQAALAAALDALPLHLKETIVLREMEGLSYREIAAVIDAPVGTVMSRLARAREQLRRALVTSPFDGGRFHAL
jgi:RNA polymerase sigma-70 factor (ECF subfamily)